MSETVVTVIDSFKQAYPNDSFLVFKVADNWSIWYQGDELLKMKLDDGQWLLIVKLTQSSGSFMNAADIKSKSFPLVYDTKSETDVQKRRDRLRDQLKNVFPSHIANVFVGNFSWRRHSHKRKGATDFLKEYGTDVDIVLS